MIARSVTVRTRREFVHHWPDAPRDVAFLASKHRHQFHVELTVAVNHGDRDVEFVLLKRWLDTVLAGMPLDIGTTSCEQLAEELLGRTRNRWNPPGPILCSVFEDGENGATVREQ